MDLEGWSGGSTPVIGRSPGMLSRSAQLRGEPGALALALAQRLLHRRELRLEPRLPLVEAGLEGGDLVVDVARLVAGLLGADVEQAGRRLRDRVEQRRDLRADAVRRVRHERLMSRRPLSKASANFSVSNVSLPAMASGLAAPPEPGPVGIPGSAMLWTLPAMPVLSVIMLRSCESRPVSCVSPNRTPFAASVVVVAFGTFCSVSLPRTKSTVELYWSTNACSFFWTASWSGPGGVTETDVVPVALNVSCRPGIADLTTLLLLYWIGPSSTVKAALTPAL